MHLAEPCKLKPGPHGKTVIKYISRGRLPPQVMYSAENIQLPEEERLAFASVQAQVDGLAGRLIESSEELDMEWEASAHSEASRSSNNAVEADHSSSD